MEHPIRDDRVRTYLLPVRVLWKTDAATAQVENDTALLQEHSGQISLNTGTACILRNQGGRSGILLDFGQELQGGVQILTWRCGQTHNARVRIRFGESAMEAMSEIGEKGSTNDHAIRDFTTEISFLGMAEIGNTGFRFVRLDLLDEPGFLEIKSVRAIRLQAERPYIGSFCCSDPLLDRIWQTGAYTAELNMQNYLWDGIKRDRLVWIGDMYPETSAIRSVFGDDAVVRRSLDFIRDETPLPGWMNGLPSYSMWWILIHRDWYWQNGDLGYLRQQRSYLLNLLRQLASLVDAAGQAAIENQFTDWSTVGNPAAQEGIIHSILLLALAAGAELAEILADGETEGAARQAAARIQLRAQRMDHGGSKQAAALLALASLADPAAVNRDILSVGGAQGLSAFLGYFVLEARAKGGDIRGCLDMIREFWGGMLQMGATSFWE
ncbi:MAG TPA: alpha-L-rhamnosidase, partial [Clostridiales bacterium]|nr:alpha-L-rhamnosidase [Clostridiales bacterium]